MAKKVTPASLKRDAKNELEKVLIEALAGAGVEVKDVEPYAFKGNTVLVKVGDVEMQIGIVSPKGTHMNYDYRLEELAAAAEAEDAE